MRARMYACPHIKYVTCVCVCVILRRRACSFAWDKASPSFSIVLYLSLFLFSFFFFNYFYPRLRGACYYLYSAYKSPPLLRNPEGRRHLCGHRQYERTRANSYNWRILGKKKTTLLLFQCKLHLCAPRPSAWAQ